MGASAMLRHRPFRFADVIDFFLFLSSVLFQRPLPLLLFHRHSLLLMTVMDGANASVNIEIKRCSFIATATVHFAVSHFAVSHYLTITLTHNPDPNSIPNPNHISLTLTLNPNPNHNPIPKP